MAANKPKSSLESKMINYTFRMHESMLEDINAALDKFNRVEFRNLAEFMRYLVKKGLQSNKDSAK